MEITSKKIPHRYRNKYMKNIGGIIYKVDNENELSKQNTSLPITRSIQQNTDIEYLKEQINNLQTQIDELNAKIDNSGDVEDPTV